MPARGDEKPSAGDLWTTAPAVDNCGGQEALATGDVVPEEDDVEGDLSPPPEEDDVVSLAPLDSFFSDDFSDDDKEEAADELPARLSVR
jgi:hypothetical protein